MLTRKNYPLPRTPQRSGDVAADLAAYVRHLDDVKAEITAILRDLNNPGALNITQTVIQNCTIEDSTIGATTPAAGKFTTMEWTGNAIIGDAGADTINFKSAAWTFTNAVTVTGTWTNLGSVTTVDLNGGTIDGTTQATGTINGAIAAGGTWTAAATWTLPAFTLGGTVTSNGQSFSGTIANLGTVTTADINGGTIDGTVIGGASAAAGTFTTLTTSSTVTHNGGTANGVAYLNGSKVLTTGSALTYNGSTFGVSGASGSAAVNRLATSSATTALANDFGVFVLQNTNTTVGNYAAITWESDTQGNYACGIYGVYTTHGSSPRADILFATRDGSAFSERGKISSEGNWVAGKLTAVATNATDGFFYVPTCAGTPTGTPTAYTGKIPLVVDSTNHKLFFYSGGSWRDAGP